MTASHPSPPSIAAADWLQSAETQAVFKALDRDGHSARAVGGAVRNTLMGMPAADIDLATTATPDLVVTFAADAGLAAVPTGLEHGTVTVIANHVPFEVTTLREDVKTFGRHAEVAFTKDWAADARRRDFTMNALYCSADGTVHDPIGGYPDLVARRVRFIGSAEDRIREDYLRILRFFRFFAEYGRTPDDIDHPGLMATTRLSTGLDNLSRERIRQELIRLLVAPGAVMAIRIMHEHGLLPHVIRLAPRPTLLTRLTEIEAHAGLPPDAVLRLGLLTVEVPEDAYRLAQMLRLSSDERSALLDVAAAASGEVNLSETQIRVLLYKLGASRYQRLILTSWARSGAATATPQWRNALALPERWTAPHCPVKGADAVAAGLPAGPSVGELVRKLEQTWIESEFSLSREALLDLMRHEIKSMHTKK